MTTSDKLSPALANHNPLDTEQMIDPYPVYAEARRDAPIFFNAPTNCWMVTRPEDITTVMRDPTRFCSKYLMSPRTPPPPEVAALFGENGPWLPTLLTTDPPSHTRLRNLLNKGLSAQRTAAMEPHIRALANELIDGFATAGEVDLIPRFAFPFTAMVIGDMLGMPRADIDTLKRWSDDWIRLVWNAEPVENLVAAAQGLLDFQRYFAKVVEERRRKPGDDLLSALIQTHLDDDARLSQEELVAVPMQLIMAGHETTLYLISNALVLLLQRPAELDAVRANPRLIANAIEEALRLDTPLFWVSRQTTTEVELGGVKLPAGATVQLMLCSANHDASLFPDPTGFDIRRPNADRNFSFGRGIHFCLGAPLARLESRVALEQLLARLPNMRLRQDQPPVRAPMIMFHGFEHLPVRWDAPAVRE